MESWDPTDDWKHSSSDSYSGYSGPPSPRSKAVAKKRRAPQDCEAGSSQISTATPLWLTQPPKRSRPGKTTAEVRPDVSSSAVGARAFCSQQSTTSSHQDVLDVDLVPQILRHLSSQDCFRAACVCRSWYAAVHGTSYGSNQKWGENGQHVQRPWGLLELQTRPRPDHIGTLPQSLNCACSGSKAAAGIASLFLAGTEDVGGCRQDVQEDGNGDDPEELFTPLLLLEMCQFADTQPWRRPDEGQRQQIPQSLWLEEYVQASITSMDGLQPNEGTKAAKGHLKWLHVLKDRREGYRHLNFWGHMTLLMLLSGPKGLRTRMQAVWEAADTQERVHPPLDLIHVREFLAFLLVVARQSPGQSCESEGTVHPLARLHELLLVQVLAVEWRDTTCAARRSNRLKFSVPRPPPAMQHLTLEQLRIVRHDPPKGSVTRILALAGTGKTSTLRCFAKAHAGKKILYLCFNRKLMEEARAKFGGLAECTTFHSIARRCMGVLPRILWPPDRWDHKTTRNLRAKDVENAIRNPFYRDHPELINKKTTFIRAMVAKVIRTLKKYWKSDDPEILTKHVPTHSGGSEMEEQERQRCLSYARAVHNIMIQSDATKERGGTSGICMTFDAFLKTFSLYCKNSYWYLCDRNGRQYDYILVDEAQDLNPPMCELISSHAGRGHTALILVGDSHQRIYSFNNCIDSLAEGRDLKFDYTFPLTGTFRSREEVTAVGGNALRVLKRDWRPFVGLGGAKGQVICPWRPFVGLSNVKGPAICPSAEHVNGCDGKVAHIFRYSRTLLDYAANLAACGTDFTTSLGDRLETLLDLVRGCWYLRMGKMELYRSAHQRRFVEYQSWEALMESMDDLGDDDLLQALLITLSLEGRGELPGEMEGPSHIFSGVSHHAVADADIHLTTCHKAKGQEWDNVRVAEDFLSGWESGAFESTVAQLDIGRAAWSREKVDELNLVYVAVTRARRRLFLGPRLGAILQVLDDELSG